MLHFVGISIISESDMHGGGHTQTQPVLRVFHIHPYLIDKAGAQLFGLYRLWGELGNRRDIADTAMNGLLRMTVGNHLCAHAKLDSAEIDLGYVGPDPFWIDYGKRINR